MKKLCLLILFILLTSGQHAWAQNGVYSLSLSHPRVTAIAQDGDGYIWFGTVHGLNRYNGTSYTVYYASADDGCLSSDHILSLCYDSLGTLWIGTECGLNYYRDGKFYHINSSVYHPTTDIEELDDTFISFVNKSGWFKMNKQTVEVTEHQLIDNFSYFSQEGKEIEFTDRDGGIWKIDSRPGWTHEVPGRPFKSLDLSDGNENISYIVFDEQGYLWALADRHLFSYDVDKQERVWEDQDHLCVSLIKIDGNHLRAIIDYRYLNDYLLKDGRPTLIRSQYFEGNIFSIGRDDEGYFWITEASHISRLDHDGTPLFRHHIGRDHPFSYIIPSHGSRRIFIMGLREGVLEVMKDGAIRQLGDDLQSVSAIQVARDGTLWMGTYNEGIIHFDENTGLMERFGKEDGIIDVNIRSILEDSEGDIWFSTGVYVSRFNPRDSTFSAINDNRYRRDGKTYDLLSGATGPDGSLFFGGSGGITVIDPKSFAPQDKDIPLKMESITVNDKPLWEKTPRLDLDHRENTLGFRFSGVNFQTGQLMNYSWKLEGYEPEWHYGSHTPDVTYSRVPAGKYTLRARVREQNGEWSEPSIALPITIHPAPWASPLATALYWIVGIGLLALAIRLLVTYRLQKERLELATRREELKQQHIDFLTNVSHELRTPLSMIYAPAKELERSVLSPSEKDMVGLISRNAEKMRELTEQLLQNESGRRQEERLSIRKNDLAGLLRSMTGMFRFAVEEKGLGLSIAMPESMVCWFDKEKVSKVYGNLLSNAIKYTPDEGHIQVVLEGDGEHATVMVKDDGIGVPEEKRGRLFDRFDRLGAEDSGIVGSGIGLNYARNLASLHRGTLEYEPNSPSGSVFSFVFPVSRQAYDDLGVEDSEPFVPEDIGPGMEEEEEKEQTIIIAEDNEEIRHFLKNLFRDRYNVISASDGLEALDNLKLKTPDLVLSDVIMPGKSGYSLCSDIKSNPEWSHIPVILLTAKADAESNVEGLHAGADAYVSKPFDPAILKATVESLLRNRAILQEKVRNLTSRDLEDGGKAAGVELSQSEEHLIRRIQKYMDENLEKENMEARVMASSLGLSYSNLYSKIKALTGSTPKAYIMTYRMNIARQLLQSGEFTVSEVAYKVGSSSPYTFSREFKNHFGYPPSMDKR